MNELNDTGCWRLLQAIIFRAFEQAKFKKTRAEIKEWAEREPNKILLAYSEMAEIDYENLKKRLIAKCG